MGNQMTEMLKGTLEGIVLAILAARPAYGYEITARLREQGFADIVEGTVYALLVRIEQRGFVDVEKVPSEKGPPRKVYSLNARGREQLDRVLEDVELPRRTHRTAPHPTQKERTDMAAKWIETVTGSLEQKKQYRQYKARLEALPEPYGAAAKAFQRYFMYYGGVTDGDTLVTMMGDFVDLWERAAADGTRSRAIVGDDPVEFAETFAQAYSGKQWIDKERARLTKAIDDAERQASNDHADAAIRVRRDLQKSFKDAAGAARRRLRRGGGQHLRPARLERSGQDHGRADPLHAAQGGRAARPPCTASTSPRRPRTCGSRSA